MEEENENDTKTQEWISENNPRPHKIPVPTQYRQAAKILKQIVEEGKSFKDLVYNNKHIVSKIIFTLFQLLLNRFFRNLFLNKIFTILENRKYSCAVE